MSGVSTGNILPGIRDIVLISYPFEERNEDWCENSDFLFYLLTYLPTYLFILSSSLCSVLVCEPLRINVIFVMVKEVFVSHLYPYQLIKFSILNDLCAWLGSFSPPV